MENFIISIIVTYNPDISILRELIAKLLIQKTDIYIIDNFSNNREVIRNNFDNVVMLEDNKGIAFAQNIGLAYALEKNYEYIVFFDQDTLISENYIDGMMKIYHEIHEVNNIAMLGPIFFDRKTQKYSKSITYSSLFYSRKEIDFSIKYIETDHIISSGLLVSIDAVKKIGLMNDLLFIDLVDTEWCLRARKINYKIYMTPEVIIDHSIGDYSRKFIFKNKFTYIHSNFRKYFICRNSVYLIIYSNLLISWKISQIYQVIAYIILMLFYSKSKFRLLYLFFIAIKDGLFKTMDVGNAKKFK